MSNSNPLTITNIAAVLKKIISPVIQAQLPIENVLFNKIKKNVGVSIANNQIYIAARTNRHSGIYAVPEGTEPNSGKSTYAQPYDSVKFLFGTLELTDQAITMAKKGDVKALASILETEIVALKDDFKADLNRQMNGDGKGVLCQTNGTGVASTALIVDTPKTDGDATDFLIPGMYIQIGTGAEVQISSVDSATAVTLASAATWVNDVAVRKSGNSLAASEIMGLAGIIDDGDNVATIHNIVRSSSPWANAHTYDTSATLTEANMIALYLKKLRYSNNKNSGIFMGPTLFAKYGSLLTSLKKTADLKEVLSGGWKGLEFMDGVGVMLDWDCWAGYVNMVDFDSLTIAEASDPFEWLEADAQGGILKRSSSNRTVWEGTLKYYLNLIGKKFKSNARMSNQTAG